MLIARTGEVLGEARIFHKFSVAGIAAYGRPDGINFWELGGQARYYLVGGFDHGLNIGGQLMYAGGSTSSGSLTSSAGGLDLGAFLGYKIAFGFGLTFDLEGGVQWMAVAAKATDSSSGQNASAQRSAFLPLVRLNLGWSF